jgi:hypothetical protein
VTDVASKDDLLTLRLTGRSTCERSDDVQYLFGQRHKFTQAMRARTLREELLYRLQHLADLLYDVTCGPDDPEEVRVVAIARAVEHLRAAVDAIEDATTR